MKYNTALPYFEREDIQEILTEFQLLLEGKGLLSMGRHVQRFEREFAEWVGTDFAVATNSCTGGLETLLAATGIGPGDEVIVPCQTFIGTASAPARLGATPVFAEVDENYLLDIADTLERITTKTRAVILVHFAGLIHPRLGTLRSELRTRGIALYEDAAHAHGAYHRGVMAGALADGACFSFYSTKNMTTGEGGMITTSDPELARRCASIRSRGLDTSAEYEVFTNLGTNQRLTEVQALMGLMQLKRLEESVKHRNEIASVYRKELEPAIKQGIISLRSSLPEDRHAYWRFVVVLGPEKSREAIARAMGMESVKVDWPYQPLVHLQPIMRQLYGYSDGDLPRSEHLTAKHICLPMHRSITKEDSKFIAKKLLENLR